MTGSFKMVLSLSCFLFVRIFAQVDECQVSRCSDQGPEIQFPFMLRHRQPEYCGYPGFELYCTEKNQTMLHLSNSVKLLVKKINYKSQEVQVHDPDDCRVTQFLKLNLSASPFKIQEKHQEDYSLLKCSSTTEDSKSYSLYPVLCFTIPGYTVYAAPSMYSIYFLDQPSCYKICNVSLPYSLPEKENVFPLNWDKPICRSCEAKGWKCRLKKSNSTEPETYCVKGTIFCSYPAIVRLNFKKYILE